MMCNNFTPWPSFRQLAPSLAKGFTDCDYAGQNVRFDLRIVAAEMARAGQEWSFGRACVIDSLRLEGIVEPRSLTHLHKKYVGLPHDGAHGALSDVRAAATVITKQLEVHTQLPRSVHALHDLQWPDWIDTEGKFKFVSGVPYFTSWGKYANQPMSKADVGYWNFILSKDFSNEIKAIASAAKLGTFPTREA